MFPRNHVLGYPPGYVMGYPPGYVMGYPPGYGHIPGYGGRAVVGRYPRRYGSLRGHVLGDGAMDTPALRAAVDYANAQLAQQQAAAMNPALALAQAPAVQLVAPVPAPAVLPANCQVPPAPGYTESFSLRRPGWRDGMLAPGVPVPGEGLVPLPLDGAAGGIFTFGGSTTQNFTALTQAPFKPVRLICIASHVPAVAGGPTTPARVQGQSFVGIRPQQASLGNVDLESMGAPTAFGTDLDYDQAEPGVGIKVQAVLSIPLAIAGESINVNMYFMGKWVA
jgi:hypothetical protein